MLYGMSTSQTSPNTLVQGHELAAHWTLERALVGGRRMPLRGRKQGFLPVLGGAPIAVLQLHDGQRPTIHSWRKCL